MTHEQRNFYVRMAGAIGDRDQITDLSTRSTQSQAGSVQAELS